MHSMTGEEIFVCITTFRRPALLRELLDSLAISVAPENGALVSVVVVDNDGEESARAVVEAVRESKKLGWPITYLAEPRRGIAQARNAAVRQSASASWIAFVDDDETVEPQWLRELIRTADAYQADIVGGPVLPKFAPGVPGWFVRGGFADRPRYRTGAAPAWLGTGNVLIRATVCQQAGGFDESFGATGGEDTRFFQSARQAGFKAVWCDEAVAREHVGLDRGNLGYLLRREYQDASLTARIEILNDGSPITYARRFSKGVARLLEGCLKLLLGCPRGIPALVQALRRIFLGLGMLGGVLGLTLRPHAERRKPMTSRLAQTSAQKMDVKP
jgi:succinoglycan biosynthesis protein ExoM